ncbi:MAG: tetratricopeptide repeat protein [Bacteroidetes bacterium]|nr:tetratricopeptide repeat protein [Bacteroidota bacterium]
MSNQKNQNRKKSPALVKNPKQKDASVHHKGFGNLFWLAAILLLTFIVFFPALNNALTNWDDPHYLNDNPLIRSLSAQNIKKIFTEVFFGNYQPLHIFSYAIEYHFYKLNPAGYHTTSVIMHLVVTFLVYRFILLLSENNTIALITALLFGIHPLHVESVAWAAERKDLLYAMFFLGSLICYIRYIKEQQKMKFIFFAFLLFVLSIMSKAMASSLPPVLILIDYFFGRKFNTKIVLEKIPFFAIALLFGFIAAHTASTTGQVSLHVFNLFERILFANLNLLSYVTKLLVPFQLSSFYPYPHRIDGHLPYYCYIAPVVVIGLLILIIHSAKKTKVILFGAGFFVACIFLVLQLFPVGPTIISERYSYLPSIGFFFVIAWLIQQAIMKRPAAKIAMYTALGVYCLFLSVTTNARCDVWKDSITLWSNVLEQFPNVGVALNNRGNIYGKEKGDLDRAMADFNRSIQYDPTYENAYVNRGIVYCLRGKFDLAIPDFNKALELKADYFDARFNRGIAYTQTNEFEKAIADFDFLEKDNREDARIFMCRGRAFSLSKRYDEALNNFNRAIELNPEYPEAWYNRASANYNKSRYKEAYNDVMEAANQGYKVERNFFETIKQAAEKNPQ